jgi:hypothetical protein
MNSLSTRVVRLELFTATKMFNLCAESKAVWSVCNAFANNRSLYI